jgi:WD40 repeat protein
MRELAPFLLIVGIFGCSAKEPPAEQLTTATSAESLTLNGHTDYVYSVAFSPDGRRLGA